MRRAPWHFRGTIAALLIGAAWAGWPAAAVAAKAAAGSSTADFDWSETLAAGKTLEIKGVNGSIEAVAAGGRQARVRADKTARRSDPDDVTIELIRHAGGVTVCAVYPARRGDRPNECAPDDGGNMNTHDNDTQVHFTIEVPSGVRFVPRTVNGDVAADGLAGPVEAYTVNGSIEVATTGAVSAATVNGSIRVEMGALEDDVEFSTVNGGITLALAGPVDADLHAATMNGSIESDFPVTIRGSLGRHSLSGTLGKGGPRIDLESVNGSVRLRRTGSTTTQ
jgi:hypothetical protein